jgi:hypothetical protein
VTRLRDCERCGALMRSADDQVEVRLEYRGRLDQCRLRTLQVRLICRACAEAEFAAHDRPNGPPPVRRVSP